MVQKLEVQQEDRSKLYWSPNELLSYNRLLNMVVGARNIGKTYAMKKYCVNRFLEKGEQFIYLRRYKSHLKGGVVSSFFDKIAHEFPGVKFSVQGNKFMINGKVAGFALPLSAWQQNKGTEFPNVYTIFYDEFLKEKDNSQYLDNEPQALLSMAESVFREKIIFGEHNVRIICCANSTTIANPFFIYFKVFPDVNKRFNTFKHNKELVVEIPNQEAFKEKKLEGRFGALIKPTEYAGISLENDFVYDQTDFIKKKTDKAYFKFCLTYKKKTYGIWIDVERVEMFVSMKYDGGTKFNYALTKEDFNEGNILVDHYKNHYHVDRVVRAFKNGQLRFENQMIRNDMYDIFSRMGVK